MKLILRLVLAFAMAGVMIGALERIYAMLLQPLLAALP